MNDKKVFELINKTINKEIKEYDTAVETVQNNLPTPEDLVKFTTYFDKEGLENTFTFLISRIIKIMRLLAIKIDES